MSATPQITFKNFSASAALGAAITDQAERLAAVCADITHLRVSVEAAHLRHRKGAQYHVHIELGVPDKELVVSRDTDDDHANEDAYVAVREAFRAMKRQLTDYLSMRQDFQRTGKDDRWDGLRLQTLRGN